MPHISGIIWQNLTDSLTEWVTDSQIWIQEMLAHLNMRMLCFNVITTVCLAGQVELKSFLGTCVNTGSSLDSCLLQLADKLKWGWRSFVLASSRWWIWLARDKAGNLAVEQDGTRMVESLVPTIYDSVASSQCGLVLKVQPDIYKTHHTAAFSHLPLLARKHF